ncbi:proliferating cell nuclear antigen-like protein [Elysia marginata]|uniref:Proliferating cell nuclear antigen-like protein n=1 Tax=Elysia marginata TaxID=1093978 RepID=A0AAV4GTT0_9GAST|nr:proliferating cell nuclear antigen-like protein [Elysia marginata]
MACTSPAAPAERSKRGPGRPPKKRPTPPLRKDGIVEIPTNVHNRLEFVYEDPSMLKSLFAYFKNLKAVDVHIRCRPAGITFFTRDGAATCRVVAELPGENMNHFYCGDTFWLGLNRENVERIFSSIDKSFFKVTILHRHDDPDNLVIIFKDAEIDKECSYRITVSTLDYDEDLFAAEALTTPAALKEPPIEFRLTAKQFKKSVTDISHYSDTLTFEKLGSHPLQFTYNRVGITYNEVYHAPETIHLRSEVGENMVFRCTVAVSNIKSLASAMVTDYVGIYCRVDGDLLFRSEVDALIMSTFTSIA